MGWALLLLILAVVAVHWFEYSRSVQEYTFAQPMSIEKHDELRTVLSEKTPIVVEVGNLPWRPEIATKAQWVVEVDDGVATSVEAWWGSKEGRKTIQNGVDLANQMDLTTGLSDLDEARAWWWLPGLRNGCVDVLEPGEVAGLSWVVGERHWIGCSHGGPLMVWLVHSRYHRYLPPKSAAGEPIDPWSLTPAEAPWIGRVQYIEVRVQPGWCLGIPAHWGWAVRAEGTEPAWWWQATQHSAVSIVQYNMQNIPQSHTEL